LSNKRVITLLELDWLVAGLALHLAPAGFWEDCYHDMAMRRPIPMTWMEVMSRASISPLKYLP
jgi:hypothetical protein